MTYFMRWIVDELDKAEKKYAEDKKDVENEHLDVWQLGLSEGRMDTLKDVQLAYDRYTTIKRVDFNRNIRKIERAAVRKRSLARLEKFAHEMKLFLFDVGKSRTRRIKAKMAGTYKPK